MTQVLKIENLSGGYNRKKIIENINIEIPKGSITALIGLNGAGKSTTIKHILGLLRPMDGEIKVNGITIRENNVNIVAEIYMNKVPNTIVAHLTDRAQRYRTQHNNNELGWIDFILSLDTENLNILAEYVFNKQ